MAGVSSQGFVPPAKLNFKTGHLSVSSKGLGWKSWKRRWFLLTRSSLIFFKHEPRGPIDISLAIGGIEFNNAGVVHAKHDKKQLSLQFPHGPAFTFKTDSVEELEEWKEALEEAIAGSPAASIMMGLPKDALFQRDNFDAMAGDGPDGMAQNTSLKERRMKSKLLCRPFALALEDINGSPSFLEKALRFIETKGIFVEGILRASADVEVVERRLQEYEEGRTEFDDSENAHVIGDCIKLILRELPASPVLPFSCNALLHAFRNEDLTARIDAIRLSIQETFPEPNAQLLYRVLQMMRTVARHEDKNRMSASAVAACMAPLLFRPLLSGECQLSIAALLDSDPMMHVEDSDGAAAQIFAATQAANQANAMALFMLENLDAIFDGKGGLFSSGGFYEEEEEEEEEDVEEEEFDREENSAQLASLEAERQELRASLAKEVRANELLRDSLANRKKTLAEAKSTLEDEVARLSQALKEQREAYAQLQTGIKGHAADVQLEPEIAEELKTIQTFEREVALLRTESDSLQRQLAHVQQKRQLLEQQQQAVAAAAAAAGGAGGGAALSSPMGLATAGTAEQRQRIESLRALKAQLKAELERTLAMCAEEQQRTLELEERRRSDDPAVLEKEVHQQRAAFVAAQAALEAEMTKGKELRRKMQLAQQRAAAASTATPTGEGVKPATLDAFNDLTAKLEAFKKQRALLMQRLASLSADGSGGGVIGAPPGVHRVPPVI